MPAAPKPALISHTYRPTLGRRIGSLLLLLFCAIFFGFPLLLLLYPVTRLMVDEPQARLVGLGGLCFLAPLGLLLLFLLVQLVLSFLGMLFANYLKLTPTGLEYRLWPYRHFRCSWTETERIGKYSLFYDALYLKACEENQPALVSKMWSKWSNLAMQHYILLSGMQGWPNGALAADIRQYAAQLFDPVSGKPTFIPAAPPTSGPSQDERLHAALSHAGALLLPVFIPLAFWLVERKKSAYVAHQAKQALVFQVLILAMFTGVFICAIAGLLIPVGLTQLSDQFAIDGRTYGLIVLVAFMLAGLLATTAGLMLVYSGIAIAQTYRGEDFRYPLLGKL
jgi:hypothetical protein